MRGTSDRLPCANGSGCAVRPISSATSGSRAAGATCSSTGCWPRSGHPLAADPRAHPHRDPVVVRGAEPAGCRGGPTVARPEGGAHLRLLLRPPRRRVLHPDLPHPVVPPVAGQGRPYGRDLGGRPVELGDRVPDHRERARVRGPSGQLCGQPRRGRSPVHHGWLRRGQPQRTGQPVVPVHVEGPDERASAGVGPGRWWRPPGPGRSRGPRRSPARRARSPPAPPRAAGPAMPPGPRTSRRRPPGTGRAAGSVRRWRPARAAVPGGSRWPPRARTTRPAAPPSDRPRWSAVRWPAPRAARRDGRRSPDASPATRVTGDSVPPRQA